MSTPELPATELSVPRKEVSGDADEVNRHRAVLHLPKNPPSRKPRTFACLTNTGDTHDNEWKGETLWHISGFFQKLIHELVGLYVVNTLCMLNSAIVELEKL